MTSRARKGHREEAGFRTPPGLCRLTLELSGKAEKSLHQELSASCILQQYAESRGWAGGGGSVMDGSCFKGLLPEGQGGRGEMKSLGDIFPVICATGDALKQYLSCSSVPLSFIIQLSLSYHNQDGTHKLAT